MFSANQLLGNIFLWPLVAFTTYLSTIKLQTTLLGTHHLISGGGGGPRVFVACKLFFHLREKTIFFFGDQRPTILFFMFRRRNFLSYASPIMYVTIWCFFWSTYFSSISTTNFFFCPHFQQFFFLTFVATNYFFQL